MFDKWKHRSVPAESAVTVLAITTSAVDRAQLQRISEKAGWRVSFQDELDATGNERVVLFDRDLPGVDWREALRRLAGGPHHRGVILVSSVVDDYLWEEVVHLGGYDVIAKPFREGEVIQAVEFAWGAFTKSLPSSPRTK